MTKIRTTQFWLNRLNRGQTPDMLRNCRDILHQYNSKKHRNYSWQLMGHPKINCLKVCKDHLFSETGNPAAHHTTHSLTVLHFPCLLMQLFITQKPWRSPYSNSLDSFGSFSRCENEVITKHKRSQEKYPYVNSLKHWFKILSLGTQYVPELFARLNK